METEEYLNHERAKNEIAKELGYNNWESCINDQPNYMVEKIMDKVVEIHHQHKMQGVLDEDIEIEAKKGQEELKDNIPLSNGWYLGFKEGAEWLLTHLKNKTK